MNHQTALTYQGKKNKHLIDAAPDCTGTLDRSGSGFWDDIAWVIYTCRECHQQIATVGGYQHWWNYILKSDR